MATAPTVATPSLHQQEVKAIESLGYRERRQFLWHRVRPRLARFLYKYRSFEPADMTSVERVRDILVQSRLRLSSPAEFNDPFDMSGRAEIEGSTIEKRAMFEKALKERGVKRNERKKRVAQMMSDGGERMSLRLQKVFRELARCAGVCSFGGDPRSILMWSHYAANHTSLCLQFEIARDLGTFSHALPVEYSGDYPAFNWASEDDRMMTVLLRKYVGWVYEKEQRIIVQQSAGQFIDFRPPALSGIIIGCGTSDSTVKQLRDLLTERSSRGFPLPKLYRAFKHESKYGLVIKKEC